MKKIYASKYELKWGKIGRTDARLMNMVFTYRLVLWKILTYTNFFLLNLIANALAFIFYIYKKNSHLIPRRSNCDLKFCFLCNFFIFQPRVLKPVYLNSLAFSDSKYIYICAILIIINQVMGHWKHMTSHATSNFPRSYLLNRLSDWSKNFRNGFRAHNFPLYQISSKSERWGC